MIMVPDFFQDESEEALRAQVKWQHEHLGLDDSFFAKLLGEDRRRFSSGRTTRTRSPQIRKMCCTTGGRRCCTYSHSRASMRRNCVRCWSRRGQQALRTKRPLFPLRGPLHLSRPIWRIEVPRRLPR